MASYRKLKGKKFQTLQYNDHMPWFLPVVSNNPPIIYKHSSLDKRDKKSSEIVIYKKNIYLVFAHGS